ncbi:ClC family H(+)/Cl(-) exchange transporter [Streptomyces subrutilus]|uniref:ClC family H(+)/Cl(-) exchange transporter n=1 Tax=Streptomyces subrutilus TaxID=36818 RepID=A0A1E5PLU2_9ACTN|nr:ClC family H(+)/Cl(-) exchange transporter [Streptomyces subrutilus]OEJ30546.1 ClC family H(+)/Cl(-) exchange transporter [Streptomyces subrutilus]
MYLVAAVAGCLVGLVGGSFRWCLVRAEELYTSLLVASERLGGPALLLPVLVTAAGAAIACAIARRMPSAAGSGIQEVEAVWRGERTPPTLWLVPARFAGGVIAMGSGLLLGREGPTVHMGAVIGAEAGRRTRMSAQDVTLLHTSLAGAGLAVAFTAPLGGILFVFEEVTKTVRPRLVLLAVIGTAAAVACSGLIVGSRAVLPVPAVAGPPMALLPAFLLFGAATGVLGAGYNRLVVGMLSSCDRVRRVGPVARAALIGAVVGLLLCADPLLGGGGEQLNERVLGGGIPAVAVLAGYCVVRFVAGPLSYAAGAPGGLFAPLLALGAVWGALVHGLALPLLPDGGSSAVPFVIAGMAAMFSAAVRAPVTGIVLTVEITGSTTLLVPLLLACFAATLTADRMGSTPVYDSLRLRMSGTGTP